MGWKLLKKLDMVALTGIEGANRQFRQVRFRAESMQTRAARMAAIRQKAIWSLDVVSGRPANAPFALSPPGCDMRPTPS